MPMFVEGAILLASAVITVPIAGRLGLGSVLGYLIAGALIGPWGLGLISNVDDMLHFAEFGVVLLLFVIGLELQPSRLWVMRRSVFGLGSAQVLGTAAIIAAVATAAGLDWRTALVAGLGLALSSTAFALQILAERNELTTRRGRAAFSILLFQDLAAIPILALIPLLAPAAIDTDGGQLWLDGLRIVGAFVLVAVIGRYALRYLLRAVAVTRIREIFTATALLTVVATALLMEEVGLSMALGAFLAGVLLADSEYRHALEADIDPFKGLLLGLFFIAVGMSINFGLVLDEPWLVLGLVGLLFAIKMPVLYGLGRLQGLRTAGARGLAAVLPQGGEFGFVIFGVAVGAGVMMPETSDLLILVVSLSMAATPFLVIAGDKLGPAKQADAVPAYDEPPEHNQVIIAGFGRFGQVVGRLLRAKRIPFTALEISPAQVDFVKKFGNKVYYGDASRLDLLRAAGADDASIFVIAIDDVDASLRTAETVTENFPNVTVYARARNRQHAYQLMDYGVKHLARETFVSGLELATDVLKGLGLPDRDAQRAAKVFREHDERRLYAHYDIHEDEERMQQAAREAAQELEELFATDEQIEAR